MALDLQFNTAAAVQNLANLDKAVANLRTRLAELANAEQQVIRINTALAGIKGINPATATSINSVANALNRLSKNNALGNIATGLTQLSSINVASAATSVNALAAALAKIKAPTGLAAVGNNLAKIGNEARQGASGVAAMAAAMNNIRAPASVNGIRSQFQAAGQAAQSASGQITAFSSAARTAAGVLAAFGIQGAAQSVVQFGKNSLQAATEVTQLGLRIKSTGFELAEQERMLAGLDKVIDKLALPLDVAYKSFGKLAQGMASAGFTSEQVESTFEGFGTGLRAFGLNADQMDRAFNAIDQTFKKGSVSMEELKQQLGEVFPAFSELAKSMSLSTEELLAMIAQGKVASATFIKLGEDIKNKYAGDAAAAAKTGQAAIQLLSNEFTRLQQVVGKVMFDRMINGINALTQAMKSEALQSFAAVVGTVLGTAIQLAANAAMFLLNGLTLLGNGLTTLGAGLVLVASYVPGLTSSFNFLAATFQTLWPLVQMAATIFAPFAIAIGVATIAVRGLSAAWTLAAGAANLFASPVVRTVAAIGALVAIAVTAGIALFSLGQTMANGSSFVENFRNNTQAVGAALTSMQATVVGSVTAMTGVAPAANAAATASENAAGGVNALGTAAAGSADGLSQMEAPASDVAASTAELQRAAGPAATSVGQIGAAAGGASGAVASLSSNLEGSVSASNSAASAALNAAAAFRELAAAKASAGEGGGGGILDSISSYFSRDGLANSSGPGTTTTVSASAFRNAPSFAGGTANTSGYPSSLPGGGIPSILHPNEAVVPLAGGGAIPISVSGGGSQPQQNGPSIVTLTLDMLTTLRDMNTNVNRVWESLDANSVILTNEFSKQNVILNTMSNNIVTLIGAVGNGFKNLTENIGRISSGSGGGGSIGGGGGGGGSIGGGGGGGDLAGDIQTARRAISQNDSGRPVPNPNGQGGGGIGYLGSDGKFYASYDYSPDKKANDAINAQNNNILQELVDKYGPQKAINALYPDNSQKTTREQLLKYYNDKYQKLGYYAMGTPNASEDMKGGGFMAVLHPDEAVIPLPDGRSVPVQLPRSFMDRMSGGANSAREERRPQINVTMNISTPDANSFRASEAQIVNKLRGQLERDARNTGPAKVTTVEDPTRRVQ